jgi:hypothetical protein
VAPRSTLDRAVAQNHRCLCAVPKPKPDGLGEQSARRQRFLAGVLQAGEDDEADCPALGRESCHGGVSSTQKVAVCLIRGERREFVNQDDDQRAANARDVLAGTSCQLSRSG